MAKLPSPDQSWSHGAVSTLKLKYALKNPDITAIESDLLMGHYIDDVECQEILHKPVLPIMAHPPDRVSDLSMEQFISLTLSSGKYHIKLDFKELETVSKTIQYIENEMKENAFEFHKTIFLNADILQGPGKRNGKPTVDADDFLAACFKATEGDDSSIGTQKKYAFSLGWSTDPRSHQGYTTQDVASMKDIILDNDILERSKGVVLAVNARVLHRDCKVFNSILREFPEIQLLVWTATGEPPISQRKINDIQNHFSEANVLSQVGFDCQIAETFGFFYDTAVSFVGFFWNLQQSKSS
jgi:hypothetical protein